jgi:hypothetical protein
MQKRVFFLFGESRKTRIIEECYDECDGPGSMQRYVYSADPFKVACLIECLEAIDRLPEKQRLALNCQIEGYSKREIADLIDGTSDDVSTLVFLARRAISGS